METSLSTAIAPGAGPQKRRRKGIFVLLSRKEPLSNDVLPTGDRAFAVRTRRRGWKGILRPFGRKVVPIADVGASIAEAIPILGAPVKGVLDALVKTLKIVEQQHQNEESIQQLLEKIETLNEHLGVNPTSRNLDWLETRLEKAEQHLKQLTEVNRLDYANVAATVSQCERDITTYLATFSAAEHFETQTMVKVLGHNMNLFVGTGFAAVQAEFARQREHMITAEERLALFVSDLIAPRRGPLSRYITVIDPFGTEHKLLQIPDSRYELGLMVLERYQRNPMLWGLLAGFVESGYIDLSIDDYRQIIPVANGQFDVLDSDSTIVMSAILTLSVQSAGWAWCPICWDSITPIHEGAERVLCGSCDRHVQVVGTMNGRQEHPLEFSKGSPSGGPFAGGPFDDELFSYTLRPENLAHLRQIVVLPLLYTIRCYEHDYKANTTHSLLPALKPIAFDGDGGIDYSAPVNTRLQEHWDALSANIQYTGGMFRKILLDVIKVSEAIEWNALDQYVDEWLGLKALLEEEPSLRDYEWLCRRLVEIHTDLWTLVTTNDLNRYDVSRTIPQRNELASSLARAFLANLSRHAPFNGILGSHPFGPHRLTIQGYQDPFADPIIAKLHQHFNLGTPAARQALLRLLHAPRAPRPGAKGTGSSTERPTRVLECPACGTLIVNVLGDDKRVLCRTCDEEVQAVPSILGEPYQGNMLPQGRLFAVRSYVGTTFSPWPLGFHRFSTTPVAVQGAMPGILAGLGRERPISV